MAERSPGAGVARRRLGTSLRKLREDANIRLEGAATELECSPAKISRLEHGLGPAKLWDIRILLRFYGITDPDVIHEHESWAQDSKKPGWWESDADLNTDDMDRYLASETSAARVRVYCTPVLPAHLQTPAYAEAHVRILFPALDDVDVARFVANRRQRQEALLRPDDPLHLEAVVDEAVVLRRVGSAAVHADALDWVADTLEDQRTDHRRDIRLRVVPLSAGPGRVLGPFSIFEPRRPDLDPLTVYLEDLADGGTWLEDEAGQTVVDAFEERLAASANEADSIRILRDAASAARQAARDDRGLYHEGS